MSRKSGRKAAPPLPPPHPVREAPPPAAPKRGNAVLLGLLAASLLLSLLFAARLPLDTNPDERAHLDYIRLLIENRGFVRFNAEQWEQYAETHQPPLYYLLCVPVYLATGGSLVAVRLVAALLQLGTIFVAFRACRDLFPRRPEIAVGAAAFVTFLPTQAQLSGAVNNDGLTTLICAAIFWVLGRIVTGQQPPPLRREPLWLGLLLGVGLLTKVSVLQLIPAMLLAYWLAARAGRLSLSQAAGRFGLALGIGLLLASPWLARNTLLYGDLLALSIYAQTGPNFTPAAIQQIAGWSGGDYLRNVGIRSFATFWYFLRPDLPFKQFVGPPLPLLVVLALALGGILGVYREAKEERGTTGGNPDTAGERRILLLFGVGLVLLVPFFTRFVLTVFQAQGRYFLPALLPVAVLSAWGWSALFGPRRRLLGALLPALVLLLLTLIALSRGGFIA